MQTVESLNPRAIASIVFVGLVVVVGLIATVYNVFMARGPRERSFLTRMSFFAWLVLALFLFLMWKLPNPWNYLVLIPYFIHLPVAVYKTCNKAQSIREIDLRENPDLLRTQQPVED